MLSGPPHGSKEVNDNHSTTDAHYSISKPGNYTVTV